MNLLPYTLCWAALAAVVLGLAFYRRMVSSKEDDYVHVNQDVAAQQTAMAKRLEQIDRWGKTLTIIAAVLGLALFCLFLYNGWVNPPRPE